MAEWREGLAERRPKPLAAVVEVPLLFESGMEAVFDRTVAVVADEDVRAERAGARGHEGLEGRTSAQLSQAEKSQRADFTVRNDGTVSELEEKLSRLLEEL
jgi:dephospho-CoA kinase